MKWTRIINLFLVMSVVVLLIGCGGGDTPSKEELAMSKIEAYAQKRTNTTPSLQDYIDAGVSGITDENLEEFNALVDNLEKEDVDTLEELQALTKRLGLTSGSEKPDLLIIAPKEFTDALKPLVKHKNETAMPTTVITLESIKEDYIGNNMPEKIKMAISDYNKKYRIIYVMLVGDSDKLPIRYIRAINTEWDTRYYPSDLYYADLYDDKNGDYDNWDFDNDGFYGTTDFSGGVDKDPKKVNVDQIDLKPDVAIGRIPASTVLEVQNYVNKVISYEFNAWKSDWVKKALVISDHGIYKIVDGKKIWTEFNHASDATDVVNSLSNFQITKFFLKDEPYWSMNYQQRIMSVSDFMNQGVGFISYGGHGDTNGWSGLFGAGDIHKLMNSKQLPIIYTVACLTADFYFGYAWQEGWKRSEEQYLTIDGADFDGKGFYKTIRPMPADIQPEKYDVSCLMEALLIKNEAGAIAYIGSVARGEHGGKALQKYFTQNINSQSMISTKTLGITWMQSMRTFVENEAQQGLMGYHYAYIAQHKTMLFGDPSLRIGGVSRIQKQDFLGEWDMVHDGWKGKLQLSTVRDDPIETHYNIDGNYTDADGKIKRVVAIVQTPNYLRGESWEDNKIILKIDFNENFDFEDDQSFTLYLFTQTKDEMAGVTYWNNNPYGVSLYREGKVKFDGIKDGTKVTPEDIMGTYNMSHDGWQGTLKLNSPQSVNNSMFTGKYIGNDGKIHKVYGSYLQNSPYILTLFIDFNDIDDAKGDQFFALYIFTQTKDGMAGITYWHDHPFGVRLQKTSL